MFEEEKEKQYIFLSLPRQPEIYFFTLTLLIRRCLCFSSCRIFLWCRYFFSYESRRRFSYKQDLQKRRTKCRSIECRALLLVGSRACSRAKMTYKKANINFTYLFIHKIFFISLFFIATTTIFFAFSEFYFRLFYFIIIFIACMSLSLKKKRIFRCYIHTFRTNSSPPEQRRHVQRVRQTFLLIFFHSFLLPLLLISASSFYYFKSCNFVFFGCSCTPDWPCVPGTPLCSTK